MPGMSGIETATAMRQAGLTTPIVALTANAFDDDRRACLAAGMDDFLVKPIEPAVLRARVGAVLRRVYPADRSARVETFGHVVFEPLTQVVTSDGQAILLTAKEFELALIFFRNLNRPLGRAYLLEHVWGRNPDLATRTLDAHVSKIRSKLGLRPEKGFKLAPVYSYGYRLERLGEVEGEMDPA